MIFDDVVAVDLGVDGGDFFEGVDDGLREEGHEAEFETVLFDEVVLVFGAQGHDGGHVDLVEGREHGGFVLSGDEALGDFLAQRGHLAARLAGTCWDGGLRGRRGGDGGWGRREGGSGGFLAGGEHVAFGNAAGFAGAGDGSGVDPGFFGEAANGGGGAGFFSGGGVRSGRGGGRGCAGGGRGVDGGDGGADFHFGAGGDFEGDFTGGFGGAFGSDFVGLEFEEGLVFFDDVAVFDVPFGEDTGADGFAHGRDFDFEEGHGREGSSGLKNRGVGELSADQSVKASLRKAVSSRRWRARLPTAGEAEAPRPA